MSDSLYSAHAVLELLLTKAAISAKPQKSTVRIPYKELLASVGQETTKDFDLVVSISMDWDSSDKFQGE